MSFFEAMVSMEGARRCGRLADLSTVVEKDAGQYARRQTRGWRALGVAGVAGEQSRDCLIAAGPGWTVNPPCLPRSIVAPDHRLRCWQPTSSSRYPLASTPHANPSPSATPSPSPSNSPSPSPPRPPPSALPGVPSCAASTCPRRPPASPSPPSRPPQPRHAPCPHLYAPDPTMKSPPVR